MDNVVSSQWREPVETQDFASHEEVSAIYPCYNQRVVIAFIACETQDFASLLNMSRIFGIVFLGHNFICRAFCICILCASTV